MIFFDPANAQRNIRVSTLREWLDWAAGNKPKEWHVSLPMIQRGFVWKPSQIIQLWDTLFQGLPFGALLVSELPEDAQSIDLVSHKRTEANQVYGRLGLVDGQQRTLAMLAGWPLPSQTPISHRVWVDFADAPRKGELLSLRITTRNQPFGYSREKPNVKLPLSDRRKAITAWENQVSSTGHERTQHPDFLQTRPWSNKKSLPLDLRDLLQWWQDCDGQPEVWLQKVLASLRSLTPSKTADATEPTSVWESLDTKHQQLVNDRICILATGLERIDEAQIPLLRVDERLFDTSTSDDNTEPPLALLFNRIGSNSTRLSDNDYVYAILKHLRPEVHQMVTALHDHESGAGRGSVASLMSSTDLALTALRLACATDPEIKTDPENPDKEDFHKLIKTDGFLDRSFLPVLTSGVMRQHFDQVLGFLDYRKGADPGLPRHALPHLSRPLVQVLLRLSQVGYLAGSDFMQNESRRCDALRFVLQWWLCTKDNRKASKKAYLVIAQAMQEGNFGDTLGYRMMDAILREGLALAMPDPSLLEARSGLTNSQASHADKIIGSHRFDPLPDDEADKKLCDFWQHWCTSTANRSLLLWLQRSYVSQMDGDPVAGRDEDTPYDYDHIVPYMHWGDWTGYAKGTRILDFMKKPHVIGNCIGNMRAWGSSDNRSDGALAAAKKLLLVPGSPDEDPVAAANREAKSLGLQDCSAIEPGQAKLWVDCLPAPGSGDRCWSFERTKSFEVAVEQRAFALYRRFYLEPGFDSWGISPVAQVETEA